MRYSLILLFLSTLFISCDMQNESEKLLIEDAIYSLERSNEAIEEFTMAQTLVFKNKLVDPIYANRARQLQNMFDSTLLTTDKAKNFIIELRNKYFTQNNLNKFSFNKDIPLKFKNEGSDTALFKTIYNFQLTLLTFDESVNAEFSKEIKMSLNSFLSLDSMKTYSRNEYSKILDNQLYLKLIELENRIYNIRQKLVEYYNLRCGSGCILQYDKFAAIIGQNSSVLHKGDKVSITAGIGEFSTAAMPSILMFNKKIEVNPDGVAIYEFSAPSKIGKYKVPVNIEYTKPDGTKDKKQYTIEYEVVD
jgi:hypothetical protein